MDLKKRTLDSVVGCSEAWRLFMNVDKTKVTHFSRNPNPLVSRSMELL